MTLTITVPQLIGAFLAAAGIPSAITGFCFWIIQQRILKKDRKKEEEEKIRREAREEERKRRMEEEAEKEKLRETEEFLMVTGIRAAIALGEATAKAVQRIPDAHCNGDMTEALAYAQNIKHKQKEFLEKQGIHNLFE